ncbi:RIP metalloprotease RseP [candidate division WOR-3 bacterium JGI_Cruoil_03_44_89]|uniref:Zinc metalloprotease n=1 Tax=candidate division WOR-3 bacterium JGI_Cruoil_03_44_89 TaxID=1973748 RepID=A0A235BVJ8_UNCW3|nr:MAG: RIP metalloprotease RseP [candidate division WOR-3 bacterium JGI_Cruoil_03_44_89]
MGILLNIVGAVIALSVLIISHEFGHFLAAKRSGIGVPEFSLGFGPRLFGWQSGETKYSVRLLLFGGYVKMAGEEAGTATGGEEEFLSKPPGVRARVIFSGPFFNLILAVVFYSCINLFFGMGTIDTTTVRSAPRATGLKNYDKIISVNGVPVFDWWEVERKLDGNGDNLLILLRDGDTLTISVPSIYTDSLIPLIPSLLGDVERDGPAYNAGLKRGDRVIQIDSTEIDDWEAMVKIVEKSTGDTLKITVLRGGDTLTTTAIPQERERVVGDKKKRVGMIMVTMHVKRKKLGLYSFYQGIKDTGLTIWLTGSFLKKLVMREMSPKNLGGPLAIVQFAGQSLSWGLSSFLSFIAFLSCQLGILNLIPFPPLDGGHLLIILVEKIIRRRPSERVSNIIQMIGFALIMFLMLYVTMNDIARIFKR